MAEHSLGIGYLTNERDSLERLVRQWHAWSKRWPPEYVVYQDEDGEHRAVLEDFLRERPSEQEDTPIDDADGELVARITNGKQPASWREAVRELLLHLQRWHGARHERRLDASAAPTAKLAPSPTPARLACERCGEAAETIHLLPSLEAVEKVEITCLDHEPSNARWLEVDAWRGPSRRVVVEAHPYIAGRVDEAIARAKKLP